MARFPRRDSDQQDDALGWRPTGIAARAGVWSARHRKVAIWGWLAFVFASVALGAAVGTKSLDNSDAGVGESGRADRTVRNAFPKHADEMVLVQSEGVNARDPSFRATVADAQRRLSAVPHTQAFENPYTPENRGNISSDGRSALLRFQIAGDDTQVQDRVAPAIDAVAAVQKAHPDFTVEEFGDASSDKEIEDVMGDDFSKALITSLPITLIILLLAFGAVVAARGAAPAGAHRRRGHDRPGRADQPDLRRVDQSINEVILLIGLAVGVDYSMFYLRREREERERGRSENASLAAAAATSGRAVLVSGFTVMIAMAGMYLAGCAHLHLVRHRDDHRRRGGGGRLAHRAARDAGLARRPCREGRRPDHLRMPWIAARERVWSRVLDRVLRHPALDDRPPAALLVVARDPRASASTWRSPDSNRCPQNLAAMKTYNKIQATFPGDPIPGRGRGRARATSLPGTCAGDRPPPAQRSAASDNVRARP